MAATVAHDLQQTPYAVPRQLEAKTAAQLSSIDYVHANSARITNRVRRVLRIPAEDVRAALEQSFRDLEQRREYLDMFRDQSQAALRYFGNIVPAITAEKTVKEISPKAPPTGAASSRQQFLQHNRPIWSKGYSAAMSNEPATDYATLGSGFKPGKQIVVEAHQPAITCWLPQGHPTSPVLFLLYMADIFLEDRGCRLSYANNICVVRTGRILEENAVRLSKNLTQILS
ncbi:hypothetical protein EDB81DRAFT_875112 [Dactylonectria macrodidyma]|uniref:Uncharacterized protein n=1 Tax=Dactylonectria macrodidyma TaxID=307937 RepID=A0A9P9JRH9_9HYPO|nr:hypothetical protein EDB81DRAFT_875112 [Dactylonectria macrodidyma]